MNNRMKNLQNYEDFLNEGIAKEISAILPSKRDAEPMLYLYAKEINKQPTVMVKTDYFFNVTDLPSKINDAKDAKNFLTLLRTNLTAAWNETVQNFK